MYSDRYGEVHARVFAIQFLSEFEYGMDVNCFETKSQTGIKLREGNSALEDTVYTRMRSHGAFYVQSNDQVGVGEPAHLRPSVNGPAYSLDTPVSDIALQYATNLTRNHTASYSYGMFKTIPSDIGQAR